MANDGGPAFPMPYSTDEHSGPCNSTIMQSGMSLRDWFAGQALANMIRDYETTGAMIDAETCVEIASDAYSMADAMLAERQKGGA